MNVTHESNSDALLTVGEAARVSYLSTDTIRRYADKGILATYRTPANHRRFRLEDVLALNVKTPSAEVGEVA